MPHHVVFFFITLLHKCLVDIELGNQSCM